MADKYTLEQLNAMDDAELDRLAGEAIMGWELSKSASTGIFRWYENGRFILSQYGWKPTTDRNQSGELLDKCRERGVSLEITFDVDPVVAYKSDDFTWNEIPGNGPRSETIAAILAAQTVEEGR